MVLPELNETQFGPAKVVCYPLKFNPDSDDDESLNVRIKEPRV